MPNKVFSLGSHSTFFIFFLGPRLPKYIQGHEMVSIGTKVVLIGGYGNEDGIYQLDCLSCDWTKLALSLQKGREDFVAIPIPMNFTVC